MNLTAMIGPERLAKGLWWSAGCGLDLVTGCTPVSPACAHCWSAERTHRAGCQKNPKIQARYGGLTDANGRFTGEVRPQWDDLDRIGRARTPKVYTFWNDLFHEGVEDDFVTSVMLRILTHPQHFYIICTKRPERSLKYFSECYPDLILLNGGDHRSTLASRLMLMTTVESQEYEQRLVDLVQIPGVLHGVSYEPALGPVDFTNIYCPGEIQPFWSTTGGHRFNALQDDEDHYYDSENHLDWLIAGGETGPHARPAHPNWFRSARDQAVAAGVPFFFKSWGEWFPFDSLKSAGEEEGWGDRQDLRVLWPSGVSGSALLGNVKEAWEAGCRGFKRVGKRAAGRALDEGEWDELPEVAG